MAEVVSSGQVYGQDNQGCPNQAKFSLGKSSQAKFSLGKSSLGKSSLARCSQDSLREQQAPLVATELRPMDKAKVAMVTDKTTVGVTKANLQKVPAKKSKNLSCRPRSMSAPTGKLAHWASLEGKTTQH